METFFYHLSHSLLHPTMALLIQESLIFSFLSLFFSTLALSFSLNRPKRIKRYEDPGFDFSVLNTEVQEQPEVEEKIEDAVIDLLADQDSSSTIKFDYPKIKKESDLAIWLDSDLAYSEVCPKLTDEYIKEIEQEINDSYALCNALDESKNLSSKTFFAIRSSDVHKIYQAFLIAQSTYPCLNEPTDEIKSQYEEDSQWNNLSFLAREFSGLQVIGYHVDSTQTYLLLVVNTNKFFSLKNRLRFEVGGYECLSFPVKRFKYEISSYIERWKKEGKYQEWEDIWTFLLGSEIESAELLNFLNSFEWVEIPELG